MIIKILGVEILWSVWSDDRYSNVVCFSVEWWQIQECGVFQCGVMTDTAMWCVSVWSDDRYSNVVCFSVEWWQIQQCGVFQCGVMTDTAMWCVSTQCVGDVTAVWINLCIFSFYVTIYLCLTVSYLPLSSLMFSTNQITGLPVSYKDTEKRRLRSKSMYCERTEVSQ